jgi:hypothetical protein
MSVSNRAAAAKRIDVVQANQGIRDDDDDSDDDDDGDNDDKSDGSLDSFGWHGCGCGRRRDDRGWLRPEPSRITVLAIPHAAQIGDAMRCDETRRRSMSGLAHSRAMIAMKDGVVILAADLNRQLWGCGWGCGGAAMR